jgi:DNA-binding NarL/FixJ family response regulator
MVVDDPGPTLTRREREIAGLATRGLTDRAIAEVLVVSIRTVETHLYNAYAKLGVTGRADLAAALDLLRVESD